MGLKPDQVVQQIGVDSDCDSEFISSIQNFLTTEIVDEDFNDVIDVVLLWWREGDGDLVDALVDAMTTLTDHGVIWLLTPKPGRSGHVAAEDISDAAPAAGLQATSSISAAKNWQGTRLVAPKVSRG
jgi:hypothetical protein